MAKKSATRVAGKTKKQLLDEAIAEAVGAGNELHLESVDFSDPNRPKVCLEVDYPILPVNQIASIEGNAGKPIYQMSKWWARRRSSVFRTMLIAAATKAPDDPSDAAKLVWDSYYANHQRNQSFAKLKVADIFMGGGTTLVEGSRLGMQMFGNDLSPVAWFVVRNELTKVDALKVQELLSLVETEVKPQTMPYYACDCPRGHKGRWTHRSSGEIMQEKFDPLAVEAAKRGDYQYDGPELIYTFWAKHGPCQSTGCDHRTPIFPSPIVAVKTLTVKAWADKTCKSCEKLFDIEQHEARMAPKALFVCSPDTKPYAVLDSDGVYCCPHCGQSSIDLKAKVDAESSALGKAKNKSIELTLLIHPDWLKGSSGKTEEGEAFGGSTTDSAVASTRWYRERSKGLALVEVRGSLPESIILPDTGKSMFTDVRSGTAPSEFNSESNTWKPKKAVFACQEPTCGKVQDVLESIERYGKTAPAAAYLMHGYCPECSRLGLPYDGRFFASPVDTKLLDAACVEWEQESSHLQGYRPVGNIQPGLETAVRTPLHKYGYHNWSDFFNPRQLLVHTNFVKAISECGEFETDVRVFVLGAFQQYLRNNNMFCIWNIQRDTTEPFFSKNNFQPPNRPVENGVFNNLGRGNWSSCTKVLFETLEWSQNPWELVPQKIMSGIDSKLATDMAAAKSAKVFPGDSVLPNVKINCGSSTSLGQLEHSSFDLVLTDPPFGDIMQYAEFSAYFFAWLKPALQKLGITEFAVECPPTAMEAVENTKRHGKDSAGLYSRLLMECWKEAARILKPSGILAFTFHHDKDGPWIAVLESLFNAGFYLEATFPVRSDETKGEGGTPGTFGAQKVEFDIIHVCRKRIDETNEISWARLRRKILQDVRQLQEIIEHHQQDGLAEADLQVIRRGKALEYYSKHYGKVYVEKGREFTVKEALAGINQLLDDQRDSTAEIPPVEAEPYTRQFLRLFTDTLSLPRDQIQKYLRGTGISPNEFIERGWCIEKSKVFHLTPPIDQAIKWKNAPRKGMNKDLDQAMFLIGACYENSGLSVNETLNNSNFVPHPSLLDILDWFSRHGGDDMMKGASQTARQLYKKWLSNNEPKVKQVQQTLFDLMEDGE